jgi:hypothetical protein
MFKASKKTPISIADLAVQPKALELLVPTSRPQRIIALSPLRATKKISQTLLTIVPI